MRKRKLRFPTGTSKRKTTNSRVTTVKYRITPAVILLVTNFKMFKLLHPLTRMRVRLSWTGLRPTISWRFVTP
jgi:hypothetical protein